MTLPTLRPTTGALQVRVTRLRRLVGRAAEELAREADAPRAVLYLPDNGRGDGPCRYGAVVIYDPNDPPPEIRDDWPSPGPT